MALWDQAIAHADEEGTPGSLAEWAPSELAALWSDFDEARRWAVNGEWSMACDWLVFRIVRLSRLAGAVSWEQVPTTLTADGTYQAIMSAAGIAFEAPTEADVAQCRAWVAGE